MITITKLLLISWHRASKASLIQPMCMSAFWQLSWKCLAANLALLPVDIDGHFCASQQRAGKTGRRNTLQFDRSALQLTAGLRSGFTLISPF